MLALVAACHAKVHFLEEFNDATWKDRWTTSEWKAEAEMGAFETRAVKFARDAAVDTGLATTADARFYGASASFDSIGNKGDKPIVIQFQVKNENDIECGGAYLKFGPKMSDPSKFGDPTPYYIMFGPDQCGYTKRTHLIFSHAGKNHLRRTDLKWDDDKKSHLFTLVLYPDATYDVYMDQVKEVTKGSIREDFDVLPPKKIDDPSQSKPADWVDTAEIDDPEDKQPEDWVTEAKVKDPDAKKPADWDDEEDGTWEPPMKENPAYKGAWSAKRIANPAYKGEWVHPQVDNPEFKDDATIGVYEDLAFAGIDVWQVKAGTVFDNIMVTDDIAEAEAHAAKTWKLLAPHEKELIDKAAAAAAETDKKKEAAKSVADLDDDDDDDEAPKKAEA